MTLCRVAANYDDEARVLDVADGARVSAIANGSKQTLRRGRLAVAGAVIHVVGADDGARQLLREIAFFIGAFRRRDKRQRIRAALCFDLCKLASDQIEGFVPRSFAELAAFAD